MRRFYRSFSCMVSALMLPLPALANDVMFGSFTMIVGLPLSVVSYAIAALLGRKMFRRSRFRVYWFTALIGLFPWLYGYLYLSFVLPNRDLNLEILIGLSLAILPAVLALCSRIYRSSRRLAPTRQQS